MQELADLGKRVLAMLRATSFYYLRHGETDWNLERRAQGHNDIPLNATGIAQAHAAKAPLARCAIATICASPLARARVTAEIVNQTLRRPLVVIDDLKECGYGPYEGMARGGWFKSWRRGETPAGAESFEGFMARALAGLNLALTHPGPVLIVSHAGVYWAIQRYARLERTFLENCCPVRHDPPTVDMPGWITTIIE
jgi:probable phosphoglycerate mutase